MVSWLRYVLPALLLIPVLAGDLNAQCMLANPSFEVPGSGGGVFGGWNQFGAIGSTTDATHGQKAARVSGPNTGSLGVSGYWQRLDSAPGEQWEAKVKVWHTPVRPVVGTSKAILNIEWRDSGENLISYETYDVIVPATPVDSVQSIQVLSGPAPAGTASTRLLLGTLQAAGDPTPDVYYDEAVFDIATPPTVDDVQWNDFPGGRTLTFSGRTWRVKGPGYYGPGPNNFCDSAGCTYVDGDGRLHLTIQNLGGVWYSTEVVLDRALGYGDYIFTTLGRLDTFHPTTVFGIFLWQYGVCYDTGYLWWNPYNEIDVEYSRWGNPANDIGQFVAQPYDWPGNIDRFDATFSNGEITSHAFRWLPDRVEYRSWRGGPGDETISPAIHSWTYTGPHIPRREQPRVHLNLWQSSGPPTSRQEVVLDAFTYVPSDPSQLAVTDPPPYAGISHLAPATPNPFSPRTTIAYTLPEDGPARIRIYDVNGRLVRTLTDGFATAGTHEVIWDGRDLSGRRAASGVYLYRLEAGSVVETRRVILTR